MDKLQERVCWEWDASASCDLRGVWQEADSFP